MKQNRSPWIYQLRSDREAKKLTHDLVTDIAIVGAGIAGVSTAFFTLKYTNKNVALIERYKLAHGATGHNGGQLVSYFERGFASLVEEFGRERAADAQRLVEGSWELLNEMYTDAGLTIPFSRFTGHAGLVTFEQVLFHLRDNAARRDAGVPLEQMRIADTAPFLSQIPAEFSDLYSLAPQQEILAVLETRLDGYVALLSSQKGCLNSALFCQEIVDYLLKHYPDRFALYEHTPVEKIILRNERAILDVVEHTVTAGRVVLCTNGFMGLTIIDTDGLDLNVAFHHRVHGTVGYMCGFLDELDKPPAAISYFSTTIKGEIVDDEVGDSYFYLTRRPFEYGEPRNPRNLLTLGGPAVRLEDAATYGAGDDYPDDIATMLEGFLKKTCITSSVHGPEHVFTWHGLMGYTKNGVRLVGEEPHNPVLMYNLGCNGVGLLPSIMGGKRIASLVAGEKLTPSIFDVPPARGRSALG